MKYSESNAGVFERGSDSYNVRVLPIPLRSFIFRITPSVLDPELIIVSLSPLVVFHTGLVSGIFLLPLPVTIRVIVD